MFIRKLDELEDIGHVVDAENWYSRRLLLKKDGMGFSMHDTIIRAGTATEIWYKHHLEAVYCIEGRGEIADLETGQVHALEPGTLYALDKNDKHILRAEEQLRMICVFNPPVTGRETHDETGAYPLVMD